MDNAFPAAERIINDIAYAIKKDPKLNDFQIIPVTLNKNKSPVHLINHSLGLESWCVPHVYCYAYNHLMDMRQQKRKGEDGDHVNHLLISALLLNPDVTLLWNMRREMTRLDLQFELHYTSVVLTRKPKTAEIFNYRKWLTKKLLNAHPNNTGLLMSEVHACHLAAELYSNNYYAWNHRIWCLSQLPGGSGSYISFLINEWIQTHKWVSTHVSDHSGFQYRQHLLNKLMILPDTGFDIMRQCTMDIEQNALWSLQMFLTPAVSKQDNQLTDATKAILYESSESNCEKLHSIPLGLVFSELFFNTDLINVYPGHESIWYHRRFILHVFKNFINNLKTDFGIQLNNPHKDHNGVSLQKSKRIENIGESLMQHLVRFETILYSRCKVEKDRQAGYAERHKAWLATIMKINLNLN